MCGRYFVEGESLSAEAFDGYGAYLDAMDVERLSAAADICPGNEAPALIPSEGRLCVRRMRWGFKRTDGGLVINARVETMDRKPMFQALAKSQRCALPATRYYEWRDGDRQRFRVSLETAGLFYLAGLYRIGEAGREFVVLTQPPVSRLEGIHDRMPLLLDSRRTLEGWFSGQTPLFTNNKRLRVDADGSEQLRMFF